MITFSDKTEEQTFTRARRRYIRAELQLDDDACGGVVVAVRLAYETGWAAGRAGAISPHPDIPGILMRAVGGVVEIPSPAAGGGVATLCRGAHIAAQFDGWNYQSRRGVTRRRVTPPPKRPGGAVTGRLGDLVYHHDVIARRREPDAHIVDEKGAR